MKLLQHTALATAAALCIIAGCTKQQVPGGSASLTIINAIPGSPALVPVFSGTQPLQWFSSAQQLNYGTYSATVNQYSSYSDDIRLALFRYPDTLAHSIPLYDFHLKLPLNSIKTLFLTGTMAAPDTLFTTDMPLYHPVTDSTTGIRFANLCAGSTPVSINIKGNGNGSEIASLSYKGVSDFKNYAATAQISSYVFEIRNASDGLLLASYTLGNFNATSGSPRYRNYTIAFKGIPGGTGSNAPGAFLINNY